ncbi:LPS export ABC transporter periplasmic protein LptC [Sphingomonas sp. BN140010]|uniref:LPS export ABC transporter periplasmic protein LptC n=1 Tax=Sphingomonas arvum TaxID=2992113 RepID=A0ABT3JF35_9SPHN|nr:LPS export ABC transporter periplasmic protein LptC [Sphingomonas sp. BN140010]MCW3797668.1 LPS export ABC transporter periplasmic protein LptC [Sphingomonas sp. BN140010]
MSEAAVHQQEAREHWAEPGSRHDRLVRLLKIGLPSLVGVLVAFLLLAPLSKRQEVSFILDKNEVDTAPERMRIESARYTGKDDKGQPFVVQAQRAVQPTSEQPIVDIHGMFARLGLQSGPATIEADRGRYNIDRQQVAVLGPVRVNGPEGEQLLTQNVIVDLRKRTVVGGSGAGTGRQGDVQAGELSGDLKSQQLGLGGGVRGRLELGEFQAGRVHADLGTRTVVLEGGARLKIQQGAVR